MTYAVELTDEDIAFIKAAILCTVRMGVDSSSKQRGINLTNMAAEVVIRLNEARLSTLDVMFINTCLQKTKALLLKDNVLPKDQREGARRQADELINKLAGVDKPRSVLDG